MRETSVQPAVPPHVPVPDRVGMWRDGPETSATRGGADDVEPAISAARNALCAWSGIPATQRAVVLHRVASPFDGCKKSGFGRERGVEALDNHTRAKSVCVRRKGS